MTTPTQGIVYNLNAKSSHGEPVYKIRSLYIFSHSGDILGGEWEYKWVTWS